MGSFPRHLYVMNPILFIGKPWLKIEPLSAWNHTFTYHFTIFFLFGRSTAWMSAEGLFMAWLVATKCPSHKKSNKFLRHHWNRRKTCNKKINFTRNAKILQPSTSFPFWVTYKTKLLICVWWLHLQVFVLYFTMVYGKMSLGIWWWPKHQQERKKKKKGRENYNCYRTKHSA